MRFREDRSLAGQPPYITLSPCRRQRSAGRADPEACLVGRLVDLMGKIGRPVDVPKLVELARAVNRPETPVTNAGGLVPGYAMALNSR